MSSSYSGASSRRSHTKSRKGCKTCKRRHIRCDETFPQCRKCSKHQVRCDYMETAGDVSQSPANPDLYWSADVETIIDNWQRTGYCSAGERVMSLQSSGHVFSKTDLHLIYNALWSGGPNSSAAVEYTVWASQTPRFLEAGGDTSFVLNALLGFGSLALAWERNSGDAKILAHQQGATALQGLQCAISAFSRENADAVLCASILLSWQANDWQSWASLVAGVRTVITSMRNWHSESRLRDTIDEQDTLIPYDFHIQHCVRHTHEYLLNYTNTLQSIELALDRLYSCTTGRDEHALVAELRDYIQRLLSARPAATPEEQFSHLYALRKWIFWVPSTRLRNGQYDHMTLVVIAYLYAVALSLEPLFPNVAPALCSAMTLMPLDHILHSFDDVRQASASARPHEQIDTLLSLLAWPQQAASSYRTRKFSSSYGTTTPGQRSPLGFDAFGQDLTHASEAFNLHQASPAFQGSGRSRMSSDYGSSQGSPYLDLPSLASESPMVHRNSLSYQSPMLPSMASGFDVNELYGVHGRDVDSSEMTGFVYDSPSPLPLWT